MVALVAERRLVNAPRRERNEIARDSFSYLHFPMVAGIVLVALGLKKTLGDVGDPLEPRAGVRAARRGRALPARPRRLPLAQSPSHSSPCLIRFETVHYSELRDRVRHQEDVIPVALGLTEPTRPPARSLVPRHALILLSRTVDTGPLS